KNGIYYGVAVCDLTTGDFRTTQIKEQNNFATLMDEISRYSPAEIIINRMLLASTEEMDKIKERFSVYISILDENHFDVDYEDFELKYDIVNEDEQKVKNLKEQILCVAASNGLFRYLQDTQKNDLKYIHKIKLYNTTHYM